MGRPRRTDLGLGAARTHRSRLFAAGIALVVLGVLLPLAPPTVAAPIVPFAPRFQTNDTGAVFVVGNNLMSCPTSDSRCAAARAGTARLNNNGFAMAPLDVDGVAGTYSSSSSLLDLPDDSDILWAGLYWGGRLAAGSGGTAATGNGTTMSFRGPGQAGYSTVTADEVFGPTTTSDRAYQGFADVTTEVQALGEGDYWGANVPAGTGADRYAGWSLVIAYRAPTLPLRNLTVFDGFTDVGQGNPQQIDISGFLAPLAGAVDAEVRMVAYEGDYSTSGDVADFQGNRLGTPLSPGSNYFNGTNDLNGASVTTRNPAHLNMLGFDLKRQGASGFLANGATSATIELASTGDRYFPGVVMTTIGLYAPDFSTSTKSVVNLSGATGSARVGDQLEYTLTYTNTGQDPAAASIVDDALPAGVTLVPGSISISAGDNAGPKTDAADGDQAEYDAGARVVRARLGTGASGAAGGVLGVGASTTLRFRVTVDEAAAGTTVTNTAELDYVAQTVGDPFTYRVRPASTDVAALADLGITKVMTPDPGVAGGTVTSSLIVANDGPSTAMGVTITDRVPPALVDVAVTSSAGTCTLADATATCQVGSVPSGGEVVVTITAQLPPASTLDSLTNTASATAATDDPDPSNNTTGAAITVVRAADLRVEKTPATPTVVPGATTTFDITVTNDGPSDAENVSITDLNEATGLVLTDATLPGASCSATAGLAQCVVPTLAAGGSATMQVSAFVSPGTEGGTPFNDTATVTSSTADLDAVDNSVDASVTSSAPQADLSMVKQGPATALAGGEATFSVTVTNAGPSDATGVGVTDLLPAGFVAVSAQSSRGTCTTGASVTCTIGTLPGPGTSSMPATATITIVAQLDPATVTGPAVNGATLTTDTADPTPVGEATATTTVTASADVAVEKSYAPDTPVAGEDVSFTITARNDGPSVAQDVVLSDALPPELVLLPFTPPAGMTCTAGAELVCDLGDLAVGESVVIDVEMAIPSGLDLSVGVVNAASVDGPTPDPSAANDEATVTVTSSAIADLFLLKSISDPVPPASPLAGGTVTYLLTVGNLGPSDAPAPVVTDTLPPGAAFVAAQSASECSAAGAIVTCVLPTAPAGYGAVFPVTVRLAPDLVAGTQITNTATIEPGDDTLIDPVSSNDAGVVSSIVSTAADLSVEKSTFVFDFPSGTFIEPASGPPGSPAGAVLIIRNDGPSIAHDVVITDSVDLHEFEVTQVRLVPGTGDPVDITASCTSNEGSFQCSLGDLPPFAPGDPSWVVQIDGAILSGAQPSAPADPYVNLAGISSGTTDPVTANDSSSAPVIVETPVTTLAVEKRSTAGEALLAGGTFAYELTVSNLFDPVVVGAASDAPDVVVTDTLPPGLTPLSATSSQGACTIAPPSTVTCALGTVLGPIRNPAPPPATITVTGTVSDAAAGTLTNSAIVTSPITTPASTSLPLPVEQSADLSLAKVPDADPFVAGAATGWALVVANAGPSQASGGSITDTLPPGVTFDPAASPGCTEGAPGEITCDLDPIPAGGTTSVRVVGRLDPASTTTSVSNTAAVTADTPDPNPADNSSTADTAVIRQADLVITKTPSTAEPSVGNPLTYTLGVTNAGPSVATDVELSDVLPPGTVGVSVDATAPLGCELSATDLTCGAVALEPGGSATATLVVDLPDGLAPGSLANTASVRSAVDDPDPLSDSATATVRVAVVTDLSVDKTVVSDPAVAGAPVTFQITVTNDGLATAPDVTTSDTLPAGTTFISATASEGCIVDEQEGVTVVTCTIGALAPDATGVSTLMLQTAPDATAITNTGSAGSGASDPDPDDNTDTVTVPLVRATALSITKTGPAAVTPGGLATYTLAYANDGPSTARAVVVTDELPDGMALSDAPGCTLDAATVRCPIGELAPGEGGEVEVVVRIGADAADGAVLQNIGRLEALDFVPLPGAAVSVHETTVEGSTTPPVPPPPGGPTPIPGDPAPPGDGVAALPITGTQALALVLTALCLLATGVGLRLAGRRSRPAA